MAEVTVEIVVYCAVCSQKISGESKREGEINIDPCDDCLSEAEAKGWGEGRKAGLAEAAGGN